MNARWLACAALCLSCGGGRPEAISARGASPPMAAESGRPASGPRSAPESTRAPRKADGALGTSQPTAAEGEPASVPRTAADGIPASSPRTAADGIPASSPRTAAARSWLPWRVVGSQPAEVATIGSALAGLGRWAVTPSHPTRALDLDLPSGARVQLGPDTLLLAFERAPDALLLVRGRLMLQRLPDAPRIAANSLRVVVPHATVSVPATAELAIGTRADKPGSAAAGVLLLRGSFELLRFGVAPQLLLAEQSQWPVVAGLTLRGAKTLADAQHALDDSLRPARARPVLVDADEHLAAALQALQSLRAEGERMLAAVSPRHAAAAPNATPEPAPKTEAEIRAYQRQLTDHARAEHAARDALQLATEQSLLKHALACGAVSAEAMDCAELRTWRERFDAALDASR